MPLRALQISAVDITGPDAAAVVPIVDRDRLGRDSGSMMMIPVKLTVAERQVFQAVRDRALAKAQARIDKATADVTATPEAPVDLTKPIPGEPP